MNISLSPELEHFIGQKVQSGLYLSASEVVREGLRLLQQSEQFRSAQLADLQGKVAVGLSQLDAGKAIPGEEAFRALRLKNSNRRSKR